MRKPLAHQPVVIPSTLRMFLGRNFPLFFLDKKYYFARRDSGTNAVSAAKDARPVFQLFFGMSWQFSAVLAAVCFAGTILTLKHASVSVSSSIALMVYLCAFTLLFFVAHAALAQEKLKISWMSVGVLLLSGVLSYVGNYFQVKSITYAPNPGYAMAVISSSVIFVTLISIFFFGIPFTFGKALGIAFCLGGVVLLSL